MRRALLVLLVLLACAPAADAALPVPRGTPWPDMRHDEHNTGAAAIAGAYRAGLKPWSYRTGKGIFSTATVGPGDTVYVGSGDGSFHAFGARGKRLWTFRAGLIDSSAVLGRNGITVGTGDEYLYHLRTSKRKLSRRKRIIWKLKARQPASGGQLVNWWEGNAELGPDGTIYAGNTGAAAYAVTPNGKPKWIFRGGNSFWTTAAIARDGTSYWASVDRSIYAIDKAGKQVWSVPTLGFVISSPALSADESTLYIGSFDGQLHALDAKTGVPKWTFQTGDHIYSSPALEQDAAGAVKALYIGSADGMIYKVDASGHEVWQYDTGDAVRSSPVLGLAPDGTTRIVYVGSSNGTLFALDANTGQRRWSFDGTPREPALRDRNDMNASPALGRKGVYIGSESGYFWFVPYDYCLHARDRRCSTDPGQAFGGDLTRVFPVTAGGTTLPQSSVPSPLPAATTLVGRLVVHQGGKSLDASMQPLTSAHDMVSAPFPFSASLSGDGHFIFIRPDDILDAGRDYQVKVSGLYTTGGVHIGAPVIGLTGAAPFSDTIGFHTQASKGPLPLRPRARSVPALRLRRLAVPLPAFLPSVNQIGFDSYEWAAGFIDVGRPDASGRGSLLAWVVGVKPGRKGRWVASPAAGFAFPLFGSYKRDAFELGLQNITLTFSFGPVPLDTLEFRGRLNRDMTTAGPNLYAEATCAKIPNYGPFLPVTTRLCNQTGKIAVGGTFLTRSYNGTANVKPRGIKVTGVSLNANQAVATLSRRVAKGHIGSILLTDAASGQPVAIDYAQQTKVDGNRITLTIPPGTQLPPSTKAWVLYDVYPLGTRTF